MQLGKRVSQEEIDSFYNSPESGVIFFEEKRIILPEEFHNKNPPPSLYWKELGEIRRKSLEGNDCFVAIPGGFDTLFYGLLEELTNQNLMTKNYPQRGDFLIEERGIYVNPGKYDCTSVMYYPRTIKDAVGYGKYFLGGRLFCVSKVIIGQKESKKILENTKI